MAKLTIVYTDGYQEHYNITLPESTNMTMTTGVKRYKDIIEDGMLKLIMEDTQIVLIPIVNIRKIIGKIDSSALIEIKNYPGFLCAELVEEVEEI